MTLGCYIYHWKPDVTDNVACDWSTQWFKVTVVVNVFGKIRCFQCIKVKKYIRIGITIFKFFIWEDISSYTA